MELKTLIVDDDKKLLSVLKSMLGEENHEVITSDNGLDAIKKCREQRFDLVITDLMMPGASGLEVLKETRKVSPDTLVILITGFASLESAVQAIREGAYDYIAKPFKLEEMKLVVRNAWERIRLARENERLLMELQEAYRQLHIVKKIMGLEKGSPAEVDEREKHQQPFIAGSMLPQYYQENRSTVYPGLLTDLERISALVEKGLLSEEEFSLCKSKLLRNLQA